MYNHLFILGSGGFAEELKHYLSVVHPQTKILMVGTTSGETVIPHREYVRIAQDVSGKCATYLGSGKCSIKERMTAEVVGELGPPVIMNASVRSALVGTGSVIADAAVTGFKSIIGHSVLINYGASIGHHTRIGDLSVISPQAAVGGFCSIGSGVYIGAGAMIREGISIADHSTVGMGAIVTRDVPPNKLITGVNQVRDQPTDRKW